MGCTVFVCSDMVRNDRLGEGAGTGYLFVATSHLILDRGEVGVHRMRVGVSGRVSVRGYHCGAYAASTRGQCNVFVVTVSLSRCWWCLCFARLIC